MYWQLMTMQNMMRAAMCYLQGEPEQALRGVHGVLAAHDDAEDGTARLRVHALRGRQGEQPVAALRIRQALRQRARLRLLAARCGLPPQALDIHPSIHPQRCMQYRQTSTTCKARLGCILA